MSIATPIQWTDDTVNPVMGCSAPCELRPSPAKAREQTRRFFAREFPDLDGIEVARRIDSVLHRRNATEIYQLRDHTVEVFLHGVDPATVTDAKRLNKAYKAALDEIYICYAHQQTMMRGSDVTKPYKRTNKGFPTQFEVLTKFPGRMAEAAMRPDLYGEVRPNKPWLDYLPRVFFVSDMADALSGEIDFDYLKMEIVDVVTSPRGRQHLWLWLTKMPWRMAEFATWLKSNHHLDWPTNLVAMTSVTSAKTVVRAKQLLEVPARFRGLSVEPLWGQVALPLAGIDWCIVGGQSGLGSKPFDVGWIRNLQAQCTAAGTALFVKQLGACPHSESSPIKLADEHGGDWNEWPVAFRIRETPPGFRTVRTSVPHPETPGRGLATGRKGEGEEPTPQATLPCRVQKSRQKPWKGPNTVDVARQGNKKSDQTDFGNPFTVNEYGREEAVRRYVEWIHQPDQKELLDKAKATLRGKNLACWCRPGLPCHADVLLRLVNDPCNKSIR